MEPAELAQILEKHRAWLNSGGKRGERASLSGADLSALSLGSWLKDANFERAILNGVSFGNADLTAANFHRAELRGANFGTATLRKANLREADLQNANLQEAQSLLSTQLAGADVAGAKLPPAIAEFEGLKTIAEATSNAQKLFIAMMGGCLYSWLTIGTTKDVSLLTNSASSPLPVIGTALPIVGFYLVAPVVLVAVYFYFHLNMQRLWEALADLPAVFPDGRPLDKMADPWLLNGFVRAHFFRLRDQRLPLSRMQQSLSILLAWCLVPATLFIFWGRFLPRHHLGTLLHVGLLVASIGGGWIAYRLSRATLRGTPRRPFVWAQAWKDKRTYKRIAGVLGACVFGVILCFISIMAIVGARSYFYQKGTVRIHAPGSKIILQRDPAISQLQVVVPRWLGYIGFSPFANVRGEDVSTKPLNWTGDVKEYPFVKGAHLASVDMRYADAHRAFLVNADMRAAELSKANLSYAKLSTANISAAVLAYADLSHANLTAARLPNADLWEANLSRANLVGATFSHADLNYANLSKADLSNANLSDANLSGANLSRADLSEAYLSDAKLLNAQLEKANFSYAQLPYANLKDAKLDEADLRGVDLTTALCLTMRQLHRANTDRSTLPPVDLPP